MNGNTHFSFLKDNKQRDTAPSKFCEKICFFREFFILATVYGNEMGTVIRQSIIQTSSISFTETMSCKEGD